MNHFKQKHNRGAAAIEFALLLPLLIFLFIGGFEVTRYILFSQKLDKTAYGVANMITTFEPAKQCPPQDGAFSQAGLAMAMSTAREMMAPYNYDNGLQGMVISSVTNQPIRRASNELSNGFALANTGLAESPIPMPLELFSTTADGSSIWSQFMKANCPAPSDTNPEPTCGPGGGGPIFPPPPQPPIVGYEPRVDWQSGSGNTNGSGPRDSENPTGAGFSSVCAQFGSLCSPGAPARLPASFTNAMYPEETLIVAELRYRYVPFFGAYAQQIGINTGFNLNRNIYVTPRYGSLARLCGVTEPSGGTPQPIPGPTPEPGPGGEGPGGGDCPRGRICAEVPMEF